MLVVRDLRVALGRGDGKPTLSILRGVDLTLGDGRILGIVGESGSGKSTLLRAIAGFVPQKAVVRGSVVVEDMEVLALKARKLAGLRGRQVAMISQDPLEALNPSMRIGKQVAEAVRNRQGCSARDAYAEALRLLERVHISAPEQRARLYPADLSGGMRQRVAIAIALACGARLLLADEPTTALDVTTQMDILRLLRTLQRETQMSVILVSHDIVSVGLISDEIAVMYGGMLVEQGKADDVLRDPLMPYTTALVGCSLWQRSAGNGGLATIEGEPLSLAAKEAGCPFGPRCSRHESECDAAVPEWTVGTNGHRVRCFFPNASRMRRAEREAAWAGNDG